MKLFKNEAYSIMTNTESFHQVVWVPNAKGHFSVANDWHSIRWKAAPVLWFKLIWAQPSVRRHFFVAWLAINNRLSTLYRVNN